MTGWSSLCPRGAAGPLWLRPGHIYRQRICSVFLLRGTSSYLQKISFPHFFKRKLYITTSREALWRLGENLENSTLSPDASSSASACGRRAGWCLTKARPELHHPRQPEPGRKRTACWVHPLKEGWDEKVGRRGLPCSAILGKEASWLDVEAEHTAGLAGSWAAVSALPASGEAGGSASPFVQTRSVCEIGGKTGSGGRRVGTGARRIRTEGERALSREG